MQNKSIAQPLFGLLITLVGAGFVADALGVIDAGNIFNAWWPLLVVAGGVISLFNRPPMYLWSLATIAAGTLLQLRLRETITFDIWSFLLGFGIVAFGLSFLFEHFGGKKVTSDNAISIFALLGGSESRSNASNFKGGQITALLGGVTLDLRDAELKGDASLAIFTAMGGVELRVPSTWEVHVNGKPILGGWEDKTAKPTTKNPPILTIDATCIMGGIEVKN